MPDVTIGLPFRDGVETLGLAIRSVVAQTHTDWHLLLVDDGSADGSRELAAAVAAADPRRVRLLADGERRGLPARLNQLARLADTPHLARMDADDVMHPDRIARQLALLAGDPAVDLVSTGVWVIDVDGRVRGARHTRPLDDTAEGFLSNALLAHSSVLGRTGWFRAHPYDEAFARAQDKELWCRTRGDARHGRLQEPLLFYREGGAFQLGAYRATQAADRAILRRHGPGLVGARRARGLIARSHAKEAAYVALDTIGAADALVRRRTAPLAEPDGRAAAALLARIATTRVPGLDPPLTRGAPAAAAVPAPLTIVMVITRSDVVGGATVYVREAARGLLDRGHRVTVVVGGRGPVVRELAAAGVPVRTIADLQREPSPLRDWRALRSLVRLLRALGPDLVVGHTAKAGLLARIAGRALGVPTLYTPHGWAFNRKVPGWQQPLYRLVERAAAALLDSAIVDGCVQERDLALRAGIGTPAQHLVVRNAVADPGVLADAGAAPVRLVAVARFARPKDHDTLVRAFARLPADVTLELVGDGPLRPATQRLAADLGVADRVAFPGVRDDVPARLRAAQAFVLSSRSETLNLTVLEAMASGLPVVATRVGGVDEAVEDGVSGLLVPPGDVEALADRLLAVVGDAALRRRLGAAGRRRYEERFTLARLVDELEARYRAQAGPVVAKRPASPSRTAARMSA